MQKTSELYKELIQKPNSRFETKLLIGDEVYLISHNADKIIFGNDRIFYTADTGGFGDNMIISIDTSRKLFAEGRPQVGCCVAGEIDVEMLQPAAIIPRMSSLKPFVRVTDGEQYSEWIPKGVYYIDTRDENNASNRLSLHGYDAILKSEQEYPAGDVGLWPKKDIDVVREIAALMEVELDERTVSTMNREYIVQLPLGYNCREILGYTAAMYGGCFIMSDEGKLLLVRINEIGLETNYLIDSSGYALVFGGDRLIVG